MASNDMPLTKELFIAEHTTNWGLSRDSINHLQQGSIERLVETAKHAHTIDARVRINGEDRWFEVDWIKHMKKAGTFQMRESDVQLMSFYNVSTLEALIDAQSRHVEKLQAQIPGGPSPYARVAPREG